MKLKALKLIGYVVVVLLAMIGVYLILVQAIFKPDTTMSDEQYQQYLATCQPTGQTETEQVTETVTSPHGETTTTQKTTTKTSVPVSSENSAVIIPPQPGVPVVTGANKAPVPQPTTTVSPSKQEKEAAAYQLQSRGVCYEMADFFNEDRPNPSGAGNYAWNGCVARYKDRLITMKNNSQLPPNSEGRAKLDYLIKLGY